MADAVHSWGAAVDSTADAPVRRTGLHRFMRRRSTIALLMCTPLILIVGCLIIYPAFYSIYLSMLNKTQTRFIGVLKFNFLIARDTLRIGGWESTNFAPSAVFF